MSELHTGDRFELYRMNQMYENLVWLKTISVNSNSSFEQFEFNDVANPINISYMLKCYSSDGSYNEYIAEPAGDFTQTLKCYTIENGIRIDNLEHSNKVISLKVFTANGVSIFEKNIQLIEGQFDWYFDENYVNSGVYFIQIDSNSKVEIFKIVL